ncbi:MAG: RnfABCDGE type electron transport complex subunit G [Clostridia bacterium]|nr:RnfABCDGE type electron transport complex subunit G [Clostridia bacterium]
MKTKKELPAWLVLTVICLVAALALGATYNGTKDRIATQEAEKAVAVRQELLPEAESFEVIEPTGEYTVYRGVKDGQDVGYVSVGTVLGFGGEVEVTVGTDENGVITGVRVGGANFSETAGLGAKSKEPKFYEQFTGKEYPVDLTKNGGEIDAITAATITSSAVVRGVNATIKAMSEAAGFTINEPVALVDELGDNRYATTKQGFGGPIYVEITMDGDAIAAIRIGDDSYAETRTGAQEESFWSQYIGKNGTNLVLGQDIDAYSGATISSTAVNDAVNLILLYVNDPEAFAAQMANAPEEVDVSIPEGAETWSAVGKGVMGSFKVTISVDEAGAVSGIAVSDSDDENDAAFLGQVKNNNAFLAQFIGAVPPVEGVDTVAGATVSSKGVIAAVNAAYNSYLGVEDTPAPTPTEAPAADGNKVIAKGLTGSFAVTVSFNDDGTVASVVLGKSDSDMDEGFLAMVDTDAFLGQFIGKVPPVDADTVSGATISSKAVIEAVNSLAPAKEAASEAADTQKVIAKGLTGSFAVTVSFNADGTIADVVLGKSDSDMDEGFLAMANTEAFLGQFIGKSIPVEADTVSGATISSKAIIEAINGMTPPAAEEEKEIVDTQKVIASGLTGKFAVTASFYADGTIAEVKLGKSDSDMDEDFLALADTDDFLGQFIGKTIPVEADAVTGATISSKAIIEAINSMTPVLTAKEEAAEPQKVIAKGLTGSFAVTVSFNADGTIAEVKISASDSDMDEDFLAKTRTDDFLGQFIGKTAPVEADTVSGATISSQAIIDAINGLAQ